jgi:hypothetical protein
MNPGCTDTKGETIMAKYVHVGAQKKQHGDRVAARFSTETEVRCRLYSSTGDVPDSRGVLLNFSMDGSYIVTRRAFTPGCFLVVRTIRYPDAPYSDANRCDQRSIFLGEVRWRKKIEDGSTGRYGIGVKYLD